MQGAAVVLAGMAAIAACSEDDTQRVAPDASTGGTSGSGTGGSSGKGGTGGSGGSSGSTGTGGAGGTGGGTGGTGGSAGAVDASDDGADATDSGPLCPDVPAGDSGVAGAGPDATIGQWRDWATATCQPCPAREIECGDLEGAATFDTATKVLRIQLAPGIAQLVSARLVISAFDGTYPDGGNIDAQATATFTVDENTLTADLSAQVPDGVDFVQSIELELDDACGLQSTVGPLWSYPEVPADSATIINIYCE
jgi:hypothetical protein